MLLDQLTLFQKGEADYVPRIFRPSYGSEYKTYLEYSSSTNIGYEVFNNVTR